MFSKPTIKLNVEITLHSNLNFVYIITVYETCHPHIVTLHARKQSVREGRDYSSSGPCKARVC